MEEAIYGLLLQIRKFLDVDQNEYNSWADLRNEFDFWKVRGIMNTSGLLQS